MTDYLELVLAEWGAGCARRDGLGEGDDTAVRSVERAAPLLRETGSGGARGWDGLPHRSADRRAMAPREDGAGLPTGGGWGGGTQPAAPAALRAAPGAEGEGREDLSARTWGGATPLLEVVKPGGDGDWDRLGHRSTDRLTMALWGDGVGLPGGGHWGGGTPSAGDLREPGTLPGDAGVEPDGGMWSHGDPGAAGLYWALRRGDAGVRWAAGGGAVGGADPKPTAPRGDGPGALDLLFQRDARRYGGAFTLY